MAVVDRCDGRNPRWLLLHGFVVVLIIAYALGWLAAGRGERSGIITADVGALVSFPLSESLAPARLAGLINPYLLVWFALSMGAFFVLQIAYGRVIGFSEVVRPIRWVGIAIIVGGTILLTATPSADPAQSDQ